MFYIEFTRNWDRSIGLGGGVYFHRHLKTARIHFHLLITLFAWFIEIQIGKDDPKEK